MRSFLLNTALALVSTILAVYAAETYLFYTGVTSNSVPYNARRLGIPWDGRDLPEVLADLRRDGSAHYSMSSWEVWLSPTSLIKKHNRALELHPLAGISNTETVLCNEGGDYAIYRADPFGFNNPGWEVPPTAGVLLLGDSFAHGRCVKSGEDIGSRLRQILPGVPVTNLSYSGNGPLIEYATFREYAHAYRPKVTVLAYFEGNDLPGIAVEKLHPVLKKYLDDASFTQNLMARQAAIDTAYAQLHALAFDGSQQTSRQAPSEFRRSRLWHWLTLADIRELVRMTQKFQGQDTTYGYEQISQQDLEIFKHVLTDMQTRSRRTGSEFMVLYLPSYASLRADDEPGDRFNRTTVLNMFRDRSIKVIDMYPVMKSAGPYQKWFPFGAVNHYNAAGYALVAQEIKRAILPVLADR